MLSLVLLFDKDGFPRFEHVSSESVARAHGRDGISWRLCKSMHMGPQKGLLGNLFAISNVWCACRCMHATVFPHWSEHTRRPKPLDR